MNPFFKRKPTKKQRERNRQILFVLCALLALFLMAFVPYLLGKIAEFQRNGNTFAMNVQHVMPCLKSFLGKTPLPRSLPLG